MQWPLAARTAVATANTPQNVAASPRRRSRRVMSTPPTMITAYAASIGGFSGAHQKSSGSMRLGPRSTNATTRPMLDGLKTCVPPYLITYLVRSDSPAMAAKRYQASKLHGSSARVPTARRISATPLPVSIALAGQTKDRDCRKVSATSSTAQVRIAARICGTLTRK